MKERIGVYMLIFVVFWFSGAARADWAAYNDCLHEPGDSTAEHVSAWTVHNRDQSNSSGVLTDIETGNTTPATVIFRMGSDGLNVSSGGAGGNPVLGTDAYSIFNGIVDFGPNTVYYGSPGWWVEIEFTGLNPAYTYTFVGTALRSNNYPERVSLFTIQDARSFTNNSSTGVVEWTTNTTKLLAGDNTGTGYVVRWDDIVPSERGSFRIRAEATADSDSGKAYPLAGFMLREIGGIRNLAPEVDAGEYDNLVWPSQRLQLSPVIEDDDPLGLGVLFTRWSQVDGPAPVSFEPDNITANATVLFPEPGDYQLLVQAWDELAQEGHASLSITLGTAVLGDFTSDSRVFWRDLEIFTSQWLDPQGSPADLDAQGGVNSVDFSILAENWYAPPASALVINEVLARNDLATRSPDGRYDDWIEIFNGSDEPIDLAGMYLTDDPDMSTLWQFPLNDPARTTVTPGGYVPIWADGDLATKGLHTNFELDALAGDAVALYHVDGVTLIDLIEFKSQTSDVSYGRDPDGSSHLTSLSPTPAASNTGHYLPVVGDTKFSVDRGFFETPFDVVISTDTAGATIRYTTDGTAPSQGHGMIYTEPIVVSGTTMLRAMAFKSGHKPTNVDTQTYLFLDEVINQATDPDTGAQVAPVGYPRSWGSVTGDYQVDPDIVGQEPTIKADLMAVPTFSLVMNPVSWFGSKGIYINKNQDGTERVCSVEYMDPNNGDQFQMNTAIAMQGGISGGGTSLNRWKSFKLSMRPRFKPTTDAGEPTGGAGTLVFKLFDDSPIRRFNTFVFDAVLNHSWLHPSSGQRNTVCYVQDQYVADLHNAMGGHSPHGKYVHLYINGLYWGMYYLHERPDHAWAAELFGGNKDQYDAIKHNASNVINNGLGGSATANYNTMLAAVNAVSSRSTDMAVYEQLTRILDVDNFITYQLANWYTDNGDWPHKNWYATHRNTPEGLWRFHSWDAEHTVENNGNRKFGDSPSDIHRKLAKSSEYRMRFTDLAYRFFFNSGPLVEQNAVDLFLERVGQIDRVIVGESARWGDNRNAAPYTREKWYNAQISRLNGFFKGRTDEMVTWLRSQRLYPALNPPAFLVNGKFLTLGTIGATDRITLNTAAPGAIIFYTLDGQDPRKQGGSVNTGPAIPYDGPFRLPYSTLIKARAYSGGIWSALSEARYGVGPVAQSLRITELMYHPARGNASPDANTEFVELQNIGTQPINLNGVAFVDGIDFTYGPFELAPQQYCLVVQDRDAFEATYGKEHLIVGVYTGSLSNGGEKIELLDALGNTIQAFRYKDGWYDSTDGQGQSLTVVDPGGDPASSLSEKTAWRPSTEQGGSPGSGEY
jgi:hypothetical protein